MKRGNSLLSTLLAVAVVLSALLAFSAAMTQYLNFCQSRAARETARLLADNVMATAIARLQGQRDFGKGGRLGDRIELSMDGGSGCLAFNQSEAGGLAVPWSTNNLESDAPTRSSLDSSVPPFCAHLVARGRCRDQEYRCEALIHLPSFPYAIACSGKLVSSGALTVAAIKDAAPFRAAGSLSGVNPTLLLPANLASNSGASLAVDLGVGSEVQGNVQAVGGVRVGMPNRVRGQVIQGARAVPIPSYNVERFMAWAENESGAGRSPRLNPNQTDLFTDVPNYCLGNLHVSGNVELDHGAVFVRGNLEVMGSVKGRGVLLVTGNTTIHRGTQLSADDSVAILCEGDVNLEGAGRAISFFDGLVYSQSKITARGLSLLGSVVSNSPDPDKGDVELIDCSLIACPVVTDFSLGLPGSAEPDDDEVMFWALARRDSQGVYRYKVFWRPWHGEWPGGNWDGPTQSSVDILSFDEAKEKIYRELEAAPNVQGQVGAKDIDAAAIDAYLRRLTELPTPENDHLTIDANRLIDPAEAARVVFWRRL